MQEAHCSLKEIIWEIIDKCNNNCSYCGSDNVKELGDSIINKDNIYKIAHSIAEYGDSKLEVNISGGDPLLLPYVMHKHILDTFKAKGIKTKIIVNPKSNLIAKAGILKEYDWVGISINDLKELELFIEAIKHESFIDAKNKVTIISNFNKTNIFNFGKIEDYVRWSSSTWQIQYTMYKGYDSNAIYLDEEANKYFKSLIEKSSANIVLADNCNTGSCSAGMHSIGILSNGGVVPCLSMRSWNENIGNAIYGNIITKSLISIWEKDLSEFRCNKFECCKDITKPISISLNSFNQPLHQGNIIVKRQDPFPTKQVNVYGVTASPMVLTYGVVENFYTSHKWEDKKI